MKGIPPALGQGEYPSSLYSLSSIICDVQYIK